jgi:hypothetical protein
MALGGVFVFSGNSFRPAFSRSYELNEDIVATEDAG